MATTMHGTAVLRSGKREPQSSYDDEEEAVAITLLDPEGLPKAPTHRQVSVATGLRLVFMAGQVARDADGNTVGSPRPAALRSEWLRWQ